MYCRMCFTHCAHLTASISLPNTVCNFIASVQCSCNFLLFVTSSCTFCHGNDSCDHSPYLKVVQMMFLRSVWNLYCYLVSMPVLHYLPPQGRLVSHSVSPSPSGVGGIVCHPVVNVTGTIVVMVTHKCYYHI